MNLHANTRAAARLAGVARRRCCRATMALRTLLSSCPRTTSRRWEALPGPPPIVGAVDAHAKFRLLGPLGGTVDRYRDMFRAAHHPRARARPEPARDPRGAPRRPDLPRLRGPRAAWTRSASSRRGRASGSRRRARRGSRWSATACARRRRWRSARCCAAPAGAKRCRAEAHLDDRPWILTSYRAVVPITPRQ